MSDVPSGAREESSGRFEIRQVGRILDLLVHELYGGDPHLTIRELVQNAHDALVELGSENRSPRPITIRVNDLEDRPYIEVLDHGIGMSKEDIESKLCVVGNSAKLESENLHTLIGKYGIGFLSAFIIADHVEVTTRRRGTPNALRWETTNKETWTLRSEPAKQFAHGTRVRLYFRDRYSSRHQERIQELRFADGIAEVVRQHCYLIPFPIRVEQSGAEDAGRQVNAQCAPWDDQQEARETFRALFGRGEPAFIHRFAVQESTSGRELRAAGVLYFQDEISYSPSVWLHVKRMLVDAEVNKLLPPYAPFVQGVVECPDLEIDLGRRRVQTFDLPYRWLRKVIAEEFQKAFVTFAQRQPEELFQLWPNVDKTVIGRLMRQLAVEDEENSKLAEAFLLAAGRYFPLYTVNQVVGAQGRPAMKNIHEMVTAARPQPGAKVPIVFTESNSPVEKDMLLSTYPEVIDVGRTTREADRALLNRMALYNESFPDFELKGVTASRFTELHPDEAADWSEIIRMAGEGLHFYGRSHDVRVERFSPRSTPAVITDSQVDSEMVEAVRRQLEPAGRNPVAEPVIDQMLKVLDSLQNRGGMLTIHLNADNELMRRLMAATPQDRVNLAVMSVCWRAVLDYYGWNSTRDMLQREKQFTQDLILSLLDTSEGFDDLTSQIRRLEVDLRQSQEALNALDWAPEGRRDAIVGVLDIEDSVARIVGEPRGGPDEAFTYLQLVLSDVQAYVESFARVIGFTGDGMQFLIEDEGGRDPRPDVRVALSGLSQRLATLKERNRDVRNLMERAGYSVPRFRVAIAYGPVYFARMVPNTINVLGLPAVQATRLCASKEMYEQPRTDLLATEHTVNVGAGWGLWRATDFTRIGEFTIAGMSAPITVFRSA